MNLFKIVEFIFVIMILVFLAIFVIFIVLCLEVYSFLSNVEAPMPMRIVILSLMALVFLYILRAILSKAEDLKKYG